MRTFSEKPKATQQKTSAKSPKSRRVYQSQSRDVGSILHTQRTIGNQATQRLLQAEPEGLEASSASKMSRELAYDFSRKPVDDASSRRQLQFKLKVSEPGDQYEQEADRVADQVMRAQDASAGGRASAPDISRLPAISPAMQSQTVNKEKEEMLQAKSANGRRTARTEDGVATIQQLSGRGEPLPTTICENMGSLIGHDLSAVRVHDDNHAHVAARGFGAQAFTMGNNIAFARGRYQPESSQGQKLLAHELVHVIQQRAEPFSSIKKIQLKRDPDVVFNGYYSFYLTQGIENEFAVQFYYSGTGTTATIKVAHQPSATMRQGTITLPEGATFNPVATVDGETTTLFDLDSDGSEEVAVQAVVDEYRREFLMAESSPMNPTYQWYNMRDIYVVASWGAGGSLSFRVNDVPPANAVTPPNWVMRSHPHPNIGMAWYDTQSSRYVIPPMGGHSPRSDGYDGPPPFFSQATTLSSLNTSYSPSAVGGEAVNDPFSVEGPTQNDLTLTHETLAAMDTFEHDDVPTWGASDVTWWQSFGGQQYLYDYKDRWVRGYRDAIRAAADTYDIPRILLAGIAWVEVGGDPDWIDSAAYALRGSEGELTTSIAPMSLQVRRAGEELGYDPDTMNDAQRDAVQASLEDPQQAIFIAARHLATLRDVDFAGQGAADLSAEEVAIIAKRYNIGPDIPLAQVRLNLDYGIAILNRGEHILELLED